MKKKELQEFWSSGILENTVRAYITETRKVIEAIKRDTANMEKELADLKREKFVLE